MTFEILKAMIKEEWRLHTSLISTRLFALFPILIGLGTFIFSLFIIYIKTVMTLDQLIQFAHYIFLFFGVSIGAFGLFGREVMNRRFGQASLVAYSSRSLPISERTLFLNFFIKDIIYYIIIWILPILLGFIIATPLIGINTTTAIFFCTTLILSFLIGLAMVFFLSTLYAHSSKLLIILLLAITILLLLLSKSLQINITTLLIPYSIFYKPTLNRILLTLFLILVPSALSFIFIKVDYPEKRKQYHNSLTDLSNKLEFSPHAYYVAKDFIDLKRSEGGIGKIIFQFLFPIVLTWIFLYIFLDLIPNVKAIMIFAIFLGIVSSSVYNMLTAFDTFNSYIFLPINVSTVIKSKLTSYLLINIISLTILILAAISINQLIYFLPALCSFITLSLYSLAMTIYFAGLHPTILLYNSKIFILYISAVAPMIFTFTIASILDPIYMLISPILLIPAFYVLKKSYRKWDNLQPLD